MSAPEPASTKAGGPPRARRSRETYDRVADDGGWTSARAEEPDWAETGREHPPGGPPRARRSLIGRARSWRSAGVDLRARGGAIVVAEAKNREVGGPPRARRSPCPPSEATPEQGWTSARAEEPRGLTSSGGPNRVDLRARGGAIFVGAFIFVGAGGPPRARRSLRVRLELMRQNGWTSARAEEPARTTTHLAVCGGPPRARRSPERWTDGRTPPWVDLRARGGACTALRSHETLRGGPPARGGARTNDPSAALAKGGPPRARRSLDRRPLGEPSGVDLRARGGASAPGLEDRDRVGWTSARAEEPWRSPSTIVPTGVDLRARGGARW